MTVLAPRVPARPAPAGTPHPAPRPRVRAVTPPPRGALPRAGATGAVPLLRTSAPHDTAPHDTAPRASLDRISPDPDVAAALGDPTGLCCALVRGAVEAIRGTRPVAQLARAVTPAILDALTTRAAVVRGVPHAGSAVPRPVLVRRARVVRLGPTSAEATVVVDDVDRVRCAAVRLEAHRGRWRAVALEIG